MSQESQNAETSTSTELTVLLDLTQTEKDLIAAEAKHKGVVYDVAIPKEMQAAKQARKELKTMRTTVEGKRLEAGRVLLGMKQTNDEKAKAMIARISALEDPIDSAIKAEETRVEAERAAAALAEQARQQGHRDAIQRMRDFPMSLQGKPVAVIQQRIDTFKELGAGEREEFQQEADDAFVAAIYTANVLLERTRESEDRDRRLAEQEEQSKKDRERIAQLEKEAADRRAADEKQEREERESAECKERARVQNIRSHIEKISRPFMHHADVTLTLAEDLKAQGQAMFLDPAFFGEFLDEAVAARESALEQIEETINVLHQIKAEREQRERDEAEQRQRDEAERARLAEEAERQRQEQARLDQQRREHEAQVEKERLDKLGLLDAVKAVVDFYTTRETYPQCIVDLIHVYGNQYPGERGHTEKRTAAKPVKKPRTQ